MYWSCRFAIAAMLLPLAGIPAARAQIVDRWLLSPSLLTTAPGFDWTGGYAGLHAGYARNDGDVSARNDGGLFGGLQAGYNLQIPGSTASAVFGVEAEASYLWRQPSRPARDIATINPQWLAAAKLRYGLVIGRMLPFATAGIAVMHRESPPDGPEGRGWQVGYLFGGGLEYAVTDQVSIKAEYNYLRLGRTPANDPLLFLRTRNLSTQTVKAGFNVRF